MRCRKQLSGWLVRVAERPFPAIFCAEFRRSADGLHVPLAHDRLAELPSEIRSSATMLVFIIPVATAAED
jgi:hypothetical protein